MFISLSLAHKVSLSMNVFAQLTRLQFHPATASVHSGGILQVELTLKSLMPVSVHIQQLAASIHFDVDHGGTLGRSKGAQRHTNSGTVEFNLGNSSAGLPSGAAPRPVLDMDEVQDRSPSDNSLNSTGVVCKNTHLLIRRHESNSPPETPNCVSPPTVAMKEGAQMLKVQDVTLEPGNNSITFTAPVRWSLLHLGLFVIGLLLCPHLSSGVLLRVDNQVPTCCGSFVPQLGKFSSSSLTSIHRSDMRCILRSPSSPWSHSQVWEFYSSKTERFSWYLDGISELKDFL